MDLKHLTWDYPTPLENDTWRARRLAEFFPFVVEGLSKEDKALLLREMDPLNLPDERKEYIAMICGADD